MNASGRSSDTPRFLPLTLLLSALLWVFTTTGGRQIFVKKVLGGAYDSQAEHLLRGDVDVDVDAISNEAMIVGDHVRMYFGPFPALLRIPLNFVYPKARGNWSRISGFCAGVIALSAFAGLVGTALRRSPLSSRGRGWMGNACVIGFALGSPLVFLLGNLSIYNEAIIWGLAWSLAALFFALRSREAQGGALTRSLLGFSMCAGELACRGVQLWSCLSRSTWSNGLFSALDCGRASRAVRLHLIVLYFGSTLCGRSLPFPDFLSHGFSRRRWNCSGSRASSNGRIGRHLDCHQFASHGFLAGV
jgi:hypothetical protein